MENGNILSARELEIFKLLGIKGKNTNQIANILGLSPLTIKSHLRRVAKRTGGRSTPHSLDLLIRAEALVIEPFNGKVSLSSDERALLRALAGGHENQKIAHFYGLTLGQVQYAVKKLYDALGAHTRCHAIYRGYQTGNLTVGNRRRT